MRFMRILPASVLATLALDPEYPQFCREEAATSLPAIEDLHTRAQRKIVLLHSDPESQLNKFGGLRNLHDIHVLRHDSGQVQLKFHFRVTPAKWMADQKKDRKQKLGELRRRRAPLEAAGVLPRKILRAT